MEDEPGGSRRHPSARPPLSLPHVAETLAAARILPETPRAPRPIGLALIAGAILQLVCPSLDAQTPEEIRGRGYLVWAADESGGAPFVSRTDQNVQTGFEVELAGMLAESLGVRPEFQQGPWDKLLSLLDGRRADIVLNGYELTPNRTERYLATRPYFVYQLQLMARRDGPVHCWADLRIPHPDGRKWKVGVLVGSAAETAAAQLGGPTVTVDRFDGATDAMLAVRNGQIDATLQDLAPSQHYLLQADYEELAAAGPPEGLGYYVIYVRPDAPELCDALNREIEARLASGDLRCLYKKYGIWNEAQQILTRWNRTEPAAPRSSRRGLHLGLIRRFGGNLLRAAGMTVFLSLTSFPLAIAIGLLVALGRMYGPWPLPALLGAYVEAIRGTPLMFQLFVLFYLLPGLGITLPAVLAGVIGLAINYSAYEAEIYRAGLQAIPRGQMEAAVSLGMSRGMALRRVIVPQAIRVVIPPVTNDFIALFKDTSVCSVIALTELTREYQFLANTYGGVVEFGLAAAVLYLAMSLPLSWFSRWFERRLDAEKSAGGAG